MCLISFAQASPSGRGHGQNNGKKGSNDDIKVVFERHPEEVKVVGQLTDLTKSSSSSSSDMDTDSDTDATQSCCEGCPEDGCEVSYQI